jgi:hypothetical protein
LLLVLSQSKTGEMFMRMVIVTTKWVRVYRYDIGKIAWLKCWYRHSVFIIARLITRAQESAHLGRGVQLRHPTGRIKSFGPILRLQRQERRAWMQAVDFAWLYTMIFSLRQQNQSCSNLECRSCKRSRPKCSSGPSAMTGYWSLAVEFS